MLFVAITALSLLQLLHYYGIALLWLYFTLRQLMVSHVLLCSHIMLNFYIVLYSYINILTLLQLCLYHAHWCYYAFKLLILRLLYSTGVSLIMLLWFALYSSFVLHCSVFTLHYSIFTLCLCVYFTLYVALPYSVIASIILAQTILPVQTVHFIFYFLKYLNGLLPPVYRYIT